MKYKDTSNSINGQYLGESVGSKLADSLSPADDGYDTVRAVEHVGTIIQDAIGVNPTALLLSIEITTLPTKTAYLVGEPLDITGMVVTGSYSGGTTGIVAVTVANVTGFDSSVPNASQIITVTVDGCTDTYIISIT
jgi:Bacterial Ig-like domain (group 3).